VDWWDCFFLYRDDCTVRSFTFCLLGGGIQFVVCSIVSQFQAHSTELRGSYKYIGGRLFNILFFISAMIGGLTIVLV